MVDVCGGGSTGGKEPPPGGGDHQPGWGRALAGSATGNCLSRERIKIKPSIRGGHGNREAKQTKLRQHNVASYLEDQQTDRRGEI